MSNSRINLADIAPELNKAKMGIKDLMYDENPLNLVDIAKNASRQYSNVKVDYTENKKEVIFYLEQKSKGGFGIIFPITKI